MGSSRTANVVDRWDCDADAKMFRHELMTEDSGDKCSKKVEKCRLAG